MLNLGLIFAFKGNIMKEFEKYRLELKKYAEKVETDCYQEIYLSKQANLRQLQHTMLLEGLLTDFDFDIISDEDLEKVELYDYWKGEDDRTS